MFLDLISHLLLVNVPVPNNIPAFGDNAYRRLDEEAHHPIRVARGGGRRRWEGGEYDGTNGLLVGVKACKVGYNADVQFQRPR